MFASILGTWNPKSGFANKVEKMGDIVSSGKRL